MPASGSEPGRARRVGKPLSLRARAMGCLSRREYSRQELRRKLLERPRSSPHVESPPEPAEAEVDAVLDWLEARKYLSDERFVESRLHARASRHGSLRIRQELSRLGVEMTPDQAATLRGTELERAREVWRRRFGEVTTDPKERARQARFLAARGFPADVVRRIVGGDDET